MMTTSARPEWITPCWYRVGRTATACIALSLALAGPAYAEEKTRSGPSDLFQLDLEGLLDLRITDAAGYTIMDAKRWPVTMTRLGEQDIEQSGATDLNRLLELLVPNTQFIDHHHLQPHLGFRGIISDREDKYLYQVNGRTMNNWTLLGADNERGIPLLGDIHTVNVVRGPASATHGPGALVGVIDIQTYNGLTFQGSDATVRHGEGNRYTSLEVRHGRRFSPHSGLFFYYGMTDVRGADSDYYIGRSFPETNGLPENIAGRPANVPMADAGQAGFGELHHKLHLSYVKGPFEVWGRFVQDGVQDRPMREIYTSTRPADVPLEEWTRGRQFRNRQFTLEGTFKKELSPSWSVDLAQSFDVWFFRDQRAGVYTLPIRNGNEKESNTRAVAVWTPSHRHALAFGGDYSYVRFHNPSYSDTLDRAPAITQRNWTVDMLSFFAEYQWNPAERWTGFLSFRTDKHTYTGWMNSPRATLIFAPTPDDTIKVMAGQSVRRSGDEEIWSQWVRNGTIAKPESLRSYEISYRKKASDHLQIGGAVFYQDYDAIGWIPSLYYSSSIGEYTIGGAEIEVTYATDRTRVVFSEGWSRLLKVSLPPGLPVAGQAITAKPYGYGDDLAEWAPFITKLALFHDLSDLWSLSVSAVHYSGFPGAKDYAEYARTFENPPSAVPLSDPDYDEPYGPNLYVNFGLEYRPTSHWTLRIDAHNLAALTDKTLSKRNHYFRLSEFSVQPASVTFTVRHRF